MGPDIFYSMVGVSKAGKLSTGENITSARIFCKCSLGARGWSQALPAARPCIPGWSMTKVICSPMQPTFAEKTEVIFSVLLSILDLLKRKAYISGICLLLAVQFAVIFAFSACGEYEAEALLPKREVSVYTERTIPAASSYELCIKCDYGSFEFYNWDRKEVKFEITHHVRAGLPEEELDRMLGEFKASVSDKSGKISFFCSYNGKNGNYQDTFSTVRVFMPGASTAIECTLKQGKLKFLDDLECGLVFDTGNADVEINKLRGIVKFAGETGNIRISSGELYSNSSIVTQTGNIRIKSYFEPSGSYVISTGTGIIDLSVPSDLNAVFESNGRVDSNEASASEPCSKFILKCGLGKIDVKRF